MFADSIAIIALSLTIGLPPLIFLLIGVRHGYFDHVDEASRSIFEENELRYHRPWESQRQMQSRLDHHGPLLSNPTTEWERWL